MLTVYGIKQCDTCRKTLKWLDARGARYRFHDLRADGLSMEVLQDWLESPLAGKLINRRSTTWRQLSAEQQNLQGKALIGLLLEFPTLIKRPVFAKAGIIAVGFDPKALEGLL